MEELILQWGFDEKSQSTIQELRSFLRINGFIDRQRGWLPHITIDIYKSDDREAFTNLADALISNYSLFKLNLKELDCFIEDINDGTLYIKPSETDYLVSLKQQFDLKLADFRIESRKTRKYHPHITLCTNNLLEESKNLALKRFKSMSIKVKYVFLYNRNMELLKKWILN